MSPAHTSSRQHHMWHNLTPLDLRERHWHWTGLLCWWSKPGVHIGIVLELSWWVVSQMKWPQLWQITESKDSATEDGSYYRANQIRAEPRHAHTPRRAGWKNLQLLLDVCSSSSSSILPTSPHRVSYMCMYCLLFTILYQQLKGIYRPVQTSCLCAPDSSEKGEELQEKHFVVLPLSITTWRAGNSKCCCRPGWVLTGLTQKEEQLKEKTNNFLLITPCWQKAIPNCCSTWIEASQLTLKKLQAGPFLI